MSISATVGAAQLFQLGVSLSDVALLMNFGRKIGNWFRVSSNDQELLASIGEDPEAILKRRGLIDVSNMERRWSCLGFIYEGSRVSNPPTQVKETAAGLGPFSWLMVAIVTALDFCLPSNSVQALIMRVYVRILDRDEELESSLRVLLSTNVKSWESAGCVRNMHTTISTALQACRYKLVQEQVLPQLNLAETEEMESFIVWLLEGKSNDFTAMSSMVFAVAVAIRKVGVKLRTEGKRSYEAEPYVHYVESSTILDAPLESNYSDEPGYHSLQRGLGSRAQQIAYPRNDPSSMIHAIPADRPIINKMTYFWGLGSEAASKMFLQADQPGIPYSKEAEIYYILKNEDIEVSTFTKDVIMLAGKAFPENSQSILLAVEELAKSVKGEHLGWLQQRTTSEHLKKSEGLILFDEKEQKDIWLQYQALVFGFYYKLLKPLVSLELVQTDAYFRGIWGSGSTTFLAMCLDFGDALRFLDRKVSRSHVLYMLSTMFAGRQKLFSMVTPSKGLLGILGPISVLSKSLLHPTDDPKEISRFMLVDLPILDLMSDTDGELFGCDGGGITFEASPADPAKVQPRSPTKEWSLHAKMGLLFGEGRPGVVMAARCAGRLVGWFNPLAADVAFLSSIYMERQHDAERGYVDDFSFIGYEISDSQWQNGRLLRPTKNATTFGLVQSKGCPALRYAAAGILFELGEEVSIATDDLDTAYGRVYGQDGGIVIS
ncbi:hypothetical protein AOQ84DRAFT_365731 [Glonium stellatum]|uniref:Uncharacterized protein n=1 Tax=Glonium stellatum TaxID=574774 RepID=A0A8E2EX52_9PEZI|nr:hypothetical protein AOQ84DRAFT_365731 [Glonium stellatum]